ncbi:MAG: zf-HC2 domain-containing protein [Vicinamibacterales bacterium]
MMHVRQCIDVRERLEAYHDGELPLDEQVAVQSHLGECVACSLAASELEELSASLREMAATVTPREGSDGALGVSARVLERLGVEAQFSITAQLRNLFQDMHLVYAGLGASLATLICVVGSASVLHAANQERPDSLAGVIAYLASSGSNANPLRLDADMMQPRAITGAAIEMSEEDAAFALAAVVSREGRIQNLEVVGADMSLPIKRDVLVAMLNEASRAQFEPAQARWGNTVAVNMVWLVTSTTVKARHTALPRPWQAPALAPMPGPIEPKPVPEAPAEPATKPSLEFIPALSCAG